MGTNQYIKAGELKPCGTYAAFTRHKKAGEEPCEVCREARNKVHREYAKRWRAGSKNLTDSAVSVRKLKALSALGWSMREVFASVGASNGAQTIARFESRGKINIKTEAIINEAYKKLCMKVPPDNRFSRIMRGHARTKGYAPPMAWDNIEDLNEQPKGLLPPSPKRGS